MTSDLDLAIRHSKRLEGRLRDGHGATGRGLHELVTSVERKLPADLVRKIRFVATLRNKLVHDLDYNRLDDREGFRRAAEEAERELEQLSSPGRRDSMRLTLVVAAALVLLFVVGLTLAVLMIRGRGLGLEFYLFESPPAASP